MPHLFDGFQFQKIVSDTTKGRARVHLSIALRPSDGAPDHQDTVSLELFAPYDTKTTVEDLHVLSLELARTILRAALHQIERSSPEELKVRTEEIEEAQMDDQ